MDKTTLKRAIMGTRKYIDWNKTGRNLLLLRSDNLELRKNVCRELNYEKGECSGNCESCKFEMDSSISRAELAKVFNVTESVIFNWEKGKTPVAVDDLLFYCRLAHLTLEEILVFQA